MENNQQVSSSDEFDKAVEELTQAQQEAGFTVKSFTLSPNSNLSPTEIAQELKERVEDYSNYKKGLPTKATYTELVFPEDDEN